MFMFQSPWIPELTLRMHDYKIFDSLVARRSSYISLHTHTRTHTHIYTLYLSITRSLARSFSCMHTPSHILTLSFSLFLWVPSLISLVIEAYKYVFSQPGAFTPPINYYRAMMRYPEKPPNSDHINVPTLLIWVSTNYSHVLGVW